MATFNVISSSNVISGSGTGGSSYLVYTANLSSSGQVITVVNEKNELGGTPVYDFVQDEEISLTITGKFPSGRTFGVASGKVDGTTVGWSFCVTRNSDDQMKIRGAFNLGDCECTIMIYVFNE